MNRTREQRAARRAGAGCPPVLDIDLVHTGVLGPAVEWPPAPPTRAPRPDASAPTITALTTGRVLRLLDASIDGLRTALESETPGSDARTRVEAALADVSRARDTLSGGATG